MATVTSFEAMKEIADHVAAFGRPEVVSIDDDTHIFHFERDSDWEDGNILFVNRNGHHFRLLRQTDGQWLFCKTWSGMFEHEEWMIEANLRRSDPRALIRLCGIGPQGQKQSFETLCLLPKDATQFRRVVWRNEILEIRFEKDLAGFTVKTSGARGASGRFTGKPWESKEAATWCIQNCSPPHVSQVDAATEAKIHADLEGNALWGMF
jgi:hypothetical protein